MLRIRKHKLILVGSIFLIVLIAIIAIIVHFSKKWYFVCIYHFSFIYYFVLYFDS